MATWYDTAQSDAIYVRVGSGGAVETSINPYAYNFSWQSQVSTVQTDLRAVAWNGAAFAALGLGGVCVFSQDGKTWTQFSTGIADDIYAVAVAGNVFVAVGANGVIIVSQDGQNWSAIDSGTTVNLWGVSVSSSQYTAVGDDTTIVSGPIYSTSGQIGLSQIVRMSDSFDTAGSSLHVDEEEATLVSNILSYTGNAYVKQVQENPRLTTALSTNYLSTTDATTENALLMDHVLDTLVALLESLGVTDTWEAGYDKFIEETTALSVSWTNVLAALNSVTEAMVADSSFGVNALSIMTVSELLGTTAAFSSQLAALETIKENIKAGATLVFNGEVYDAWILNTENKAVTRYSNFNFTSMAATSTGTYATDGSMIYKIGGADDAGETISAMVESGTMDFGTAMLKNIRRAYIGLRTDGAMLLKLTTDQNKERWYELTQTQDGLHNGRLRLQRGVKARYWTYQLNNINGSDFDLDSIELLPMVLSRRIRR